MAITNAQQYQQLVRKDADGKRPGYRGDAAYRSRSAQSSTKAGGQGNVSTKSERGDGPTGTRDTKPDRPPSVGGLGGADAPPSKKAIDNARKFQEEQKQKREEAEKKRKQQEILNFFDPRPKAYTLASLIPGAKKNLGAQRRKYKKYLEYKGAPIPDFLEDEENLTSYDTYKDLLSYKPTTYTSGVGDEAVLMDAPDTYADFLYERGNPTLKMKGDVGGLRFEPSTGEYVRTGDGGQDQPIIPIVPKTTGIASTTAGTTGTTAASDTSDLDDYIAQMREGAAYRFFADGGRADDEEDYVGGIMDLKSARQMYGLGKLVKKVTRGIKKIAKSPVGKVALLAGGAGLLSKAGFGLPSFLKSEGLKNFFFKGGEIGLKNLTQRGLLTGIGGLSALAGLMTPKEEEDEDTYLGPTIDIAGIRQNPYAAMGETYRFAADGGLMRQNYAEGSKEPVAKKTMPLLDMDGMEKDYRADGGFVPIGRMERADDVPARLSKNEFVFTADAVRNAGDGDVDKGAEVMYNMMKNLEAGGNVSEESQGLDGARKMFQTSQRLEEVL